MLPTCSSSAPAVRRSSNRERVAHRSPLGREALRRRTVPTRSPQHHTCASPACRRRPRQCHSARCNKARSCSRDRTCWLRPSLQRPRLLPLRQHLPHHRSRLRLRPSLRRRRLLRPLRQWFLRRQRCHQRTRRFLRPPHLSPPRWCPLPHPGSSCPGSSHRPSTRRERAPHTKEWTTASSASYGNGPAICARNR
jgi:hypothetical protein